MERVHSSELLGVNAYFTNFDNRIVNSSTDKEALKRSAERTLKILLLTKNNVVCAASHLVNPIAFSLLNENPILLEKQLVIPAFRSDKQDVRELFEGKRINRKRKQHLISFYDEKLTKTVLWDLTENSTWFRDTFVNGLITDNSVIRSNLSGLSDLEISSIVQDVKSHNTLGRGDIEAVVEKYDIRTKRIIRNYRELVYHISGARVVNCESTLPQENYIDYSLADLKHHRTLLSEVQVFWKMFIELILDSLHRYRFPIEALDVLSFEDIYELRQPISGTSFISNYNRFYQLAVDSVTKDSRDDILYNYNELCEIKDSLEKQFNEVFEQELKPFFKKKALQGGWNLLKNAGLLGLGFFPLIGQLCSLLDTASNFKSCQFNVMQTISDMKAIRSLEDSTRYKAKIIQEQIQQFDISSKCEMIDVVAMIQDTIIQKSMI